MPISDLDKQIEICVIEDSLFGSGIGMYEEVIDEAFADAVKKVGIKPPKVTQGVRGTQPVPIVGPTVKLSDMEGQEAQAKRVSDYNAQSTEVANKLQAGENTAAVETKRRAAGAPANEIGAKDSLNPKSLPVFDEPADVEFRKQMKLNQGRGATEVAAYSAAEEDRPGSQEGRVKTAAKLELEANAAEKFKKTQNFIDLGLVRADAEDKGKIALEREGLKDFRLQNNRKWFGARFLGNLKANSTEKALNKREQEVGVINAKTPAAHQEARLGRAVYGMGLELQGQERAQTKGKASVSPSFEGPRPGNDAGAGPGPGGDTGVKVGPNAGNPTGNVGKSHTDAEAMAAEEDEPYRGMHARGGAPVYYDFRRRSNYAEMGPRALRPVVNSVFKTMMSLGQRVPR